MKKRLLHNFGYLISIPLFVLAIGVIHHKLKQYHYQDIVTQLKQISVGVLFLAALLTALDYFVLTGYDALALRYIQHPLKYSKIAVASFIGYVFSHNTTIIGGSAARYRIYSALGIPAEKIAKLVIFCVLTFWLGFFAISGIVFVFKPQDIPAAFHMPFVSVWPIGVVFLVLVGTYVFLTIFRKNPLKFRGWEVPVPTMPISLGQIVISSLDWALAAAVLYVLLPTAASLTYPKFLAIFLLAQVAGLMSSIPGGLGVFETVILLLLTEYGDTSAIIGSLLLYRLIYYILPLGIASVLLASHEVLSKKRAIVRLGIVFGRWSSVVTPHILAFTTFVAGAILLFSGALPAAKGRLVLLRDLLPLPAIEISHFFGSLIGAGLLILARGLQRRLDAAFHLTVALLVAGIVVSLLKDLGYEEAIILSIMLAALLSCRGEFYRRASLISQRFTPAWTILVIVVLLSSVWIGLFSYKHVAYSNQLWWQFTIHGDAPRFLRASLGAAIVVLLYGAIRLSIPAKPKGMPSDLTDLEKAECIVRSSRKTYANLALLGDKKFIFNEKQNAFIMYAVEGRSWIALGDPVGPEQEWDELFWRFRSLCDRYDGWSVFYQIESKNLDLYLDLGMSFFKLGEEGCVPLQDFSLEGNSRKTLRYSHNKIMNENHSFAIIPSQGTSDLLYQLKIISDTWLAEKNTKEKRFSLGFFNPDYIKRFPVAIVRQNEKIVAFANIWIGAEKEELSIDLMRFLPDAPSGIMDYLFVELMLWGKREGYQWFNLGMAPFSGFEDRTLAPFWSRAGAFVFRYGEHFYNFQGLRQYKEKFDPQWQPKYLACPRGLMLPRILTNLAALISGGIKGVVTK